MDGFAVAGFGAFDKLFGRVADAVAEEQTGHKFSDLADAEKEAILARAEELLLAWEAKADAGEHRKPSTPLEHLLKECYALTRTVAGALLSAGTMTVVQKAALFTD